MNLMAAINKADFEAHARIAIDEKVSFIVQADARSQAPTAAAVHACLCIVLAIAVPTSTGDRPSPRS